MAVYTDVGADDLNNFLAGYDLGALLSYKGIAEGVENSNFLVHTAKALPFTVLILSVFFRKMPAELFEAATLDHCGHFQAFSRIAKQPATPRNPCRSPQSKARGGALTGIRTGGRS